MKKVLKSFFQDFLIAGAVAGAVGFEQLPVPHALIERAFPSIACQSDIWNIRFLLEMKHPITTPSLSTFLFNPDASLYSLYI
jgi:hypothetical protein